MKKIAITTGDPAGIGPEIASKAIRFLPLQEDFIYIIYGKILPFPDGNIIKKIRNVEAADISTIIYWIEIDDSGYETGKPSSKTGKISYNILERCMLDLKAKKLDAVVTCPISKKAIRETHPSFIGHTEYFAEKTGSENVIMSFWGPYFNLALLTTHIPVSNLGNILNRKFFLKKLKLIYNETKKIIKNPKLVILAVNPHAGENGAFGFEDNLLKQVLAELLLENIIIDGPFPADSFFAQNNRKYDMLISAYHDQGLIPFKMISSEEGVNVTLGLPFVRTSVDHGTAFDIAGKNLASEKSLKTAVNFAEQLLDNNFEKKADNYTVFARFYDRYMSHVNYQGWVSFVLKQFNKTFLKSPQKVLELACGTANISTLLVQKELEVDAVDISSEMLSIAAQKSFKPILYQADILNKTFPGKYDLILLLFDSINYFLESRQVHKILKNAYQSLQKQGMFIFDITTLKNCEDNFDGFVNLEDNTDDYMVHQSEFNYGNFIQTTNLTFFLKKGYLFSRKDEIHKQKIYKVKEIVEIIKENDFKLIGIYSIDNGKNQVGNNYDSLDRRFTRIFFVLEKNAV